MISIYMSYLLVIIFGISGSRHSSNFKIVLSHKCCLVNETMSWVTNNTMFAQCIRTLWLPMAGTHEKVQVLRGRYADSSTTINSFGGTY